MSKKSVKLSGGKAEIIRKIAMENPFLSITDVAKNAGATRWYARDVIAEMRDFGYYRDLECEIQLEEFFEANPTAGYKEAAKRFNVSVERIAKTLEGTYKDSREDANTKFDEEMWERRALRPAWYVEEVCGAGYMGIELPDDEFKRYLEIREKKRQKGVKQSKLPLYLIPDYKRKRGNSFDEDDE